MSTHDIVLGMLLKKVIKFQTDEHSKNLIFVSQQLVLSTYVFKAIIVSGKSYEHFIN